MSKIFSYNFEKYSVKDIVEFCEKEGVKTAFQQSIPGKQERGFLIVGTPILIRFPAVDSILKSDFNDAYSLTGDVRWDNHDNMYFSEESLKNGTYDEKNEELLREHEVLFNNLKHKFAMKKGEVPKSIKDLEWIKKLR